MIAGVLTGFVITRPVSLLKVRSASMEPSLVNGSLCLVNRISGMDNVDVGDIVVFSLWDETLVAHRVQRINEHGFVTKGDANDTEDIFMVTKENYYGKVMFSF